MREHEPVNHVINMGSVLRRSFRTLRFAADSGERSPQARRNIDVIADSTTGR